MAVGLSVVAPGMRGPGDPTGLGLRPGKNPPQDVVGRTGSLGKAQAEEDKGCPSISGLLRLPETGLKQRAGDRAALREVRGPVPCLARRPDPHPPAVNTGAPCYAGSQWASRTRGVGAASGSMQEAPGSQSGGWGQGGLQGGDWVMPPFD